MNAASEMRSTVDRRLFEGTQHNPSIFVLAESMGVEPGALLDFCVPCNPYFPTAAIRERLRARLDELVTYYPSDIHVIGKLMANVLGEDAARLVPANGSDELIAWIDELFAPKGLCTAIPTFGRWVRRPRQMGKPVATFALRAEDDFALDADAFVAAAKASGTGAAVIVNPNNPTGGFVPLAEMTRMIEALADLDLVVVDESFIDFVSDEDIPSCAALVARHDNLIVLKSLGKNLGLHGVRLGYALCSPARADRLRKAMPMWSVNALAEAVIRELAHHGEAYEAARRRIVRERRAFQAALERVPGIRVLPSATNFVTFRVPDGEDGPSCRDQLLTRHGIFVRECGNKEGMGDRYIRVASKTPEENARLVAALHDLWGPPARTRPVELDLVLPLPAPRPSVDHLCEAVLATIEAAVERDTVESAVPMAVGELLETAIGRTETVTGPGGVRLHLRVDGNRVSIRVSGPGAAPTGVDPLVHFVDWLRAQRCPKEAYQALLRRAFQGEAAPGELALGRVVYESNGTLRCDVSPEGVLTLHIELDASY